MPYDEDPGMSREQGSDGNEKPLPNGKEGEPEESEREEKYSFLQETIKQKPISREKLIKQFVRIAIYGVILGGFACLGFFALKPFAQNWFMGNPETVTIPEDEEPSEDQDDAAEEEPVPQVLDEESYEELMEGMYAAAREAQKGVATVTAVLAEWDWSMEAAGGQPSVTGAVTADNGQELLILADNSVCSGAQAWAAGDCPGKYVRISGRNCVWRHKLTGLYRKVL